MIGEPRRMLDDASDRVAIERPEIIAADDRGRDAGERRLVLGRPRKIVLEISQHLEVLAELRIIGA